MEMYNARFRLIFPLSDAPVGATLTIKFFLKGVIFG